MVIVLLMQRCLPARDSQVHKWRTARWRLGSHDRPLQGQPPRGQCSALLLAACVGMQRKPGAVATVAVRGYGKGEGDQGCRRWCGGAMVWAAG